MSARRSFTVGAHPRLEIRIQSGRVDVESGTDGTIEVELQGRGSEDVEVEALGDSTVVVRQRGDSGSGWLVRSSSVRLHARVPEGTDLDLQAASADAWVDGRLGRASFKTASGDVNAGALDALDVKTASGDVKVDRVSGDLTLSTASGDVYAGEIEGRVEARLASGDLRLATVRGEVRASTASGDIRIDRFEGSDLSVKSVSGDLVIGVPAGTRADLDLSSFSGQVRLPERRAGGEPGDRYVRMAAKSISGDIVIERL